ncbi:unnamed protein product [Paramecium octaurelia]|uniref:Tetratricopeptide repeat protein n=1 Tax=Paramecium octaurelia TaxID=43137 RepID=A0A8S1YPX3_PAROT|nr:unnamed protein product [Paramecium octaurelia]
MDIYYMQIYFQLFVFHLNLFEEAVESFALILGITSDHPLINLLMGKTLFNLGRKEESIEYFDVAIKNNPMCYEAYLRKSRIQSNLITLGMTLFNLDRYREAIESFAQLIEMQPTNYEF